MDEEEKQDFGDCAKRWMPIKAKLEKTKQLDEVKSALRLFKFINSAYGARQNTEDDITSIMVSAGMAYQFAMALEDFRERFCGSANEGVALDKLGKIAKFLNNNNWQAPRESMHKIASDMRSYREVAMNLRREWAARAEKNDCRKRA